MSRSFTPAVFTVLALLLIVLSTGTAHAEFFMVSISKRPIDPDDVIHLMAVASPGETKQTQRYLSSGKSQSNFVVPEGKKLVINSMHASPVTAYDMTCTVAIKHGVDSQYPRYLANMTAEQATGLPFMPGLVIDSGHKIYAYTSSLCTVTFSMTLFGYLLDE